MGKLEQYAKRLEAKKAKARAEIEKLESEGYYIPESIKSSAYSTTPSRVSKRTYLNTPNLNLHRIRSHRTLQLTNFKRAEITRQGTGFTTKEPVVTSVKGTPKQMTDKLNKMLKNAKPSAQLASDIQRMIIKIHPDESYEIRDGVEIDSSYDPSKDWTISQHIKFTKPLSVDEIKFLLGHANVTPEAQDVYERDSAHRTYMSNIYNKRKQKDGTYIDSPLKNLSQETIDTLESVMNTSQAWNIAKRGMKYEDGKKDGRIQDRWTKLFKALDDIQNTNDEDGFDELVSMIENEESFSTIMAKADEIITNAMKGE